MENVSWVNKISNDDQTKVDVKAKTKVVRAYAKTCIITTGSIMGKGDKVSTDDSC